MKTLLSALLLAGLLSGCATTAGTTPDAGAKAEREPYTGSNIPRKRGDSGAQPVTSHDKEAVEQALSRSPVGPGN